MDFKIKFKTGHLFVVFAVAFIIFLGGMFVGKSLDWDSDKILQPIGCFIGLAIAVGGIISLISVIHSPSRSNSKIDIDSFTEAAINDAIEDKWNEVKKQVLKA